MQQFLLTELCMVWYKNSEVGYQVRIVSNPVWKGEFNKEFSDRLTLVRLLAERYDTKSNVKKGGFDLSFKRRTRLSALKNCDTTKQFVCG